MLILASNSPRRKELLSVAGLDFITVSSDFEEIADPSLSPAETAMSFAKGKAEAVAKSHPTDTVIGADTIVVLSGEIMGKPKNADDAKRMLSALSGTTHSVITAVAIVKSEGEKLFYDETRVEFYPLSEKEIDDYIATGEPFDKAGAYGIQGKGMLLVKGLEGDFYNVMGLPIARVIRSI